MLRLFRGIAVIAGREIVAGARLVLDGELLAEMLRQILPDQAGADDSIYSASVQGIALRSERLSAVQASDRSGRVALGPQHHGVRGYVSSLARRHTRCACELNA